MLDPILAPPTVQALKRKLQRWIVKTPVFGWHTPEMIDMMGANTHVEIKLELFQNTNTFKPRGAINVMLNGEKGKLKNGVVAVSGGNHGIAVAYAAKQLGYHAKIVIPKTASPLRRQRCEYYGAEVIPCEDFASGVQLFEEIEAKENRLRVHPHEGLYTIQGAATLAAEWEKQCAKPLDAVIVSIGGGGLIAGVGSYFKQVWPNVKIYGVEPTGAPTLHHSLEIGTPSRLDVPPKTIADSLAMSTATPYTFSVLQQVVDDIVLVTDDQMRWAMHLLFTQMKLVAEPACAAPVAALLGPLREKLAGQRVGIIACGSNLDIAAFAKEVFQGQMAV